MTERDFNENPYSADEARVAKWFSDHGTGGGDDPIGAMIAGLEYRNAQIAELRESIRYTLRVTGLSLMATKVVELNALINSC